MIRSRASWGAVVLTALVPAVAAAQTPRNPFADLFGRGPVTTGEFTSVQVRTTAGAQIGQTLEEDFDSALAVPEGLAAGADATLVAEHRRSRFQASAQSRYAYQEYRTAPAFGAPAIDAHGRVNYHATNRISVQGGGHFSRSPFFRLLWQDPALFGPSLPSGDNGAIFMQGNDTVEGTAGMLAQLTRRTSLSVDGFARKTVFVEPTVPEYSSRGGRATFRQQLNRVLTLRAGYGREEVRQASASGEERFANELLDLGVDFAKAMSMGRRTTFSLVTETSVVRENGGPRHYRLNGQVGLDRRFLRTWVATLSARRATEFMPGFRGPVFTENGRFSLAGYFNKRLLLNANADAIRGEIGTAIDASRFTSYTADATLTYGITRNIGVFGQYAYGDYQMPSDPLSLIAVPRLARQAVSVGVKTWVSLYDKEKVPSDPR